MQDDAYVQFFDGGSEPRLEVLGGKCASLATMTAAGMPVPPGFTITTALYEAFVERAGIAGEIRRELSGLDPDDVAAVDEVSARIRDRICSCDVPEDLRRQVLDAYAALQSRFADEVPVAVRSSATAEDLPGASFAGQQDTYLWLRGSDAVLEHVRQCWASLYTSRAILYRLKNGITDDGLAMAVAVQKMVNARAAGVAITMDPSTGDRSKITVDASYGVGEMVVSGQVTPDNIVLDKVLLCVVSETVGDKHAELVPDPTAGALVEREVDEDRRRRRCLTDDELTAVAAMAKRAEKHYGCPQDVEWALDADLPPGEDLLLLQSRPETVHSSVAAPPPATAPAAATPGFSFAGISLTPGLGRA
jgi:pyruvate, water dikinase